MRNWRKLTWFILIVQVLFVIWIISAAGATEGNCSGLAGTEFDACQAGTAIGATIGFGFILILWAVVDVILGVTWLVTNRQTRVCPACGTGAKPGVTKCKRCGFDFAQAAHAI